MLTYAIGDIHGCADQLDRLLGKIEEHRAGRPRKLVFLGDYIDRGPDSAKVVATLRKLQAADPERVVCLRGNHEQMMIDAIRTGDDHLYHHWLMNGGEAALDSFEAAMPNGMDRDTLAWINQLPLTAEDAQRYFVHAGFDPRRPAPQDDTKTCLWIREPFLSADHDFGKHVVHGHTPLVRGDPDVRRFRTNLDTGCVFGGWLTAGIFTEDQPRAVEFLQVQ